MRVKQGVTHKWEIEPRSPDLNPNASPTKLSLFPRLRFSQPVSDFVYTHVANRCIVIFAGSACSFIRELSPIRFETLFTPSDRIFSACMLVFRCPVTILKRSQTHQPGLQAKCLFIITCWWLRSPLLFIYIAPQYKISFFYEILRPATLPFTPTLRPFLPTPPHLPPYATSLRSLATLPPYAPSRRSLPTLPPYGPSLRFLPTLPPDGPSLRSLPTLPPYAPSPFALHPLDYDHYLLLNSARVDSVTIRFYDLSVMKNKPLTLSVFLLQGTLMYCP